MSRDIIIDYIPQDLRDVKRDTDGTTRVSMALDRVSRRLRTARGETRAKIGTQLVNISYLLGETTARPDVNPVSLRSAIGAVTGAVAGALLGGAESAAWGVVIGGITGHAIDSHIAWKLYEGPILRNNA